MQKDQSNNSYEIVQTISGSGSRQSTNKTTELFRQRANAIRTNVTDKKNFMQQKKTDQQDQLEKSESCPKESEKAIKFKWEDVLTREQCEEYVKQEHPEYGENLCKAIAIHITDEAIKQTQDKNYRSYLAHRPDERLSKSSTEQQQQWDWMNEVTDMKDKFKKQQL